MTATPAILETHAPCPCGAWEFRELVLATALVAHLRYCPRCRRKVLVVHKRAQFIAALPCRVASGGSVRMAIRVIAQARRVHGREILAEWEISALLDVIREVESNSAHGLPDGAPVCEPGAEDRVA